MGENIQSISQGTYTIGASSTNDSSLLATQNEGDVSILQTPQEVSHDNTLSGNGTVESPLGVVPGYNETVLWSGDALTGTLNESPWNFEKLGFETSGSLNSLQYNEFPAISGKNMMAMTTIGPESTTVWHFTPSQISFNGNTFTLKSCDFYVRTNKTTISWNDGDHIKMIKVIGINRISGGNE